MVLTHIGIGHEIITSWSIPGATRSLVINLSGVKHRFWNSDANWGLFPKKSAQRKHTQRFAFKSREFTCSWSIPWTSRPQSPFFGLVLVFLILTNKILWPLQVFQWMPVQVNWSIDGAVFLALWVTGRRVKWSKTSYTHKTSYTRQFLILSWRRGIHWSFCKRWGTKKRWPSASWLGVRHSALLRFSRIWKAATRAEEQEAEVEPSRLQLAQEEAANWTHQEGMVSLHETLGFPLGPKDLSQAQLIFASREPNPEVLQSR